MINLPDRPILCLSIVAIVVAVIVLAYMRRTRFRMVPEGQVAVITRFGKFDRVAGPGLIQFNEHHDEIRHYVDVRNQPDTYRVDGLRSYGLPFGYTLNFWRRTDLRAAGREDPECLRDLALLSDGERRIQIVNLLRKTLLDQLAALEAEQPVLNPDVVAQVVPILPGLPRCNEMVNRLGPALAVALPNIGVYLDPMQPLLVTQVHLGAELIEGFIRGRKLAMLTKQVPGLSAEALVRAFGMVEGLDAFKVNQMIMEGNLSAATLEMRQTSDQGMEPRLKIRPGEQPRAAQPASQPACAPAPPPAVRPAAGKETLTPDDLSVLKRAPAYQGEKRQTG